MKTGSDGDCSDSDAAMMSTDRLSAAAQYAFIRREQECVLRELQLRADSLQMLVSLRDNALALREQHSAELDESAAISASAGAALSASAEDISDGTDTPVPQQRDGRLLQCLYEYVVD